jgi:hypothetical protein
LGDQKSAENLKLSAYWSRVRVFDDDRIWLLQADSATGYMDELGLSVAALFATLAINIELGGGILLLVGYRTHLVARAAAPGLTLEDDLLPNSRRAWSFEECAGRFVLHNACGGLATGIDKCS